MFFMVVFICFAVFSIVFHAVSPRFLVSPFFLLRSTGKALVAKPMASLDPLFELVDPPHSMYFVDYGLIQYTQGQASSMAPGGSTWASNFESEGLLPDLAPWQLGELVLVKCLRS